jgi:hypothetical protein
MLQIHNSFKKHDNHICKDQIKIGGEMMICGH